ncbi:MAG: VOC family protein [Gammaproteobacteria bacterium]|jgi:catechol 2,3-dioxygenase-like lactoylglutathione lyase family enzyme|nr:VOC family protein [Gammaproteobacteria bacterium]MBT6041904.1 VOC family protein [Gammaproteobacteria bacterium]
MMTRRIPISALIVLLSLLPLSGQAGSISHIQLAAPSPLQAVDWYTRFLGCEAIAGRDEAVNCHGMDIEFMARPILGTTQGTGVDHISFSFPDVAAKIDELEKIGVGGMGVRLQRFDDGSAWRDIEGFFKVGFIFDPWGTSIELVQDPEHEGFHHIHLSATNPADTLAWYESAFGGERGNVTASLEGLKFDETWLLVSVHDAVEPAPTEGRALDHIAFTDADLNALVTSLANQDKPLLESLSVPANARSQARRAFMTGPDNVRLALVENGWAGLALVADNAESLTQIEDYRAPLTPWGEPDIQGIWSGDAAHGIPLQRPEDVPATEALSQVEAAARRERGTLRSIWGYEREWRDTTLGYTKNAPLTQVAMIIDPPDGRLPSLTDAALARQQAGRNQGQPVPAGPEDLNSWVRCITQGLPNHMMPTVYNNGLQIVQGPGSVVIQKEMIHENRIIPIDAPPVNENIKQWLGEPRGWWEEDSLVIETRNFNGRVSFQGSSENMVLTERFTRVAPNLLQYQFTVDDPEVWSQPWTAMFPLVLDNAQYDLVEYACHEGNYAMSNILSGARDSETQ